MKDTTTGEDFFLALEECLVKLYRHGDRTIAQSYPTDPYKNASCWPVPFGELTNLGKQKHFALGQWLRKRYDNFLSKKYLAKEFHITSSNYDRCLMSAASNLAGLYPPIGDQVWNPSLQWQPIPIHTSPNKKDGMLALEKPCPRFTKLLEDELQKDHYLNIAKENEKLYAYLTENTGKEINDLVGGYGLYDTLFVENLMNFTLPDWTKSVFPEKLKDIAWITFEMETHTPELAKFRVGQLFDKIFGQFDSYVEGEGSLPKFQVFSAHDTNVFNVLNSLRIRPLNLVPYASVVIFELRQNDNGQYFVKLLYKHESETEELKIPGCSSPCDYNEYKTLLQPLSLNEDEWDDLCQFKES
ncbi:hypothetical protein WA026_016750 [Henosepilachna vigintioctopunctata]|uniref:acid phosphatase n=1 Tax=Henosepilachna vigintioctopunctata TaxID=420089 RepID=A0AAW1USL1_9CUCU